MSEPISLDKLSPREARELYRAWNEDDLVHRVLTAGQKTPAEKWQEYLALHSFGRVLKPEPSRAEQQAHAEMWERYYDRIRRFEEWRRQRGGQPQGGAPAGHSCP
jgi:hypothetical protein